MRSAGLCLSFRRAADLLPVSFMYLRYTLHKDFWTIFELKIEGDNALKICTHCMDQTEVTNDGRLETSIRDGENDVKALEGHFPALSQLKNRGDHVKF